MYKKQFKASYVIGAILIILCFLASVGSKTDNKSLRPSNSSYVSSYSTSYGPTKHSDTSNSKPAMTKEVAEALKGTGYKGTRPNSWAESHELQCAQIKCDVCGMHTDNGYNSACDSCREKGYH